MTFRDAVAHAPTAVLAPQAATHARRLPPVLTRATLAFACLLALFATHADAAPAGAAPANRGATVTVLVAAAYNDVMQPLITDYARRTGMVVRPTYNSSAALARQVEAGTGELFLSADSAWIDYLVRKKAIDRKDRHAIIGNRLVLIAPSGSRTALRIADGMPIAAALGPNGKLAISDPAAIPAGQHARSALTRLKVWDSVRARIATSDSGRNTVSLVANSMSPLGIVLQSEAKLESRVRVLDVFPLATHPKLVHEAVLGRNASEGARAFLRYLQGPDARALFLRFGYAPLP
jgi:molybdate transport system substrate-binding protein